MRRIRLLLTLSMLLAMLLVLGACGRGRNSQEAPASAAGETVAAEQANVPADEQAATSDATAEPEAGAPEEAASSAMDTDTEDATPTPIDKDKTIITPSGLQYTETVPGTGKTPQKGDIVAVHYTGTLEDGTVFDSSRNRGEPLRFPLGMGRVIAGWDEGIALMAEGGQAVLVIPPDLAYGSAGAGGVIPPNATLIFDVELVEVTEGAPAAPTEVAEDDYETTPQGVKYYDFVIGDGPSPKPGQAVTVNYTGWLQDGDKFDSSIDHGEPFTFNIGMGQVIAGWDIGVATMKVGGKRQLVIPPDLGYGAQGAGGGIIPPNATLVFEIELLGVQ